MDFKETEKALNKFAKEVIRNAKRSLKSQKRIASGNLARSLNYDVDVFPNSFGLSFLMEDYGMFIDKGVQGADPLKSKNRTSPYKYSGRFKMIPPSSLDKWVIRKGIKGVRDEKGRFIKRQSLKYAIATSIYQKGIKASMFFTKPFEKAFRGLPEDLIKAYALDVEDFLEFTTKDNL